MTLSKNANEFDSIEVKKALDEHSDAWRAYYQWMPRGTQVVEYTLRLNSSGRFSLPPTRVEAMYAPEIFGETPIAPLVVQP